MRDTLGETGSAVTVLATLYALFVRPWSKKARQARAERKMMRLWFRGSTEKPGFWEALASGPERVQKNADDIALLKENFAKIKRGNERAIAETVRTRESVDAIRDALIAHGIAVASNNTTKRD